MTNKNLEKLISTKSRRLQKLKEQQSLKGTNTPPEILIEIEDLEKEIAELQAKRQQAQEIQLIGAVNTASHPNRSSKKNMATKSKAVSWEKIGAIAGVVSVIIALIALVVSPDLRQFIFSSATPTPMSSSFPYQVRVQAKNTGEGISNANVILEVGGKAPLDGVADGTGLARIFVDAGYAGRPGRLIVEADGYTRFKQEIDITEGALPKDILLEPTP